MSTPDSLPPPSPAPSRQRRLLVGGVAALAAAAGAGMAWWRLSPHEASDTALAGLWQLEFDTPAGGRLALASLRGKPLLINFWATWCPPCVEELPLLDGFFRQNGAKAWQVVGLAIDQPSAVRTFLTRTPVSFPVGMAGLGGTELGKTLGNQAGGLPFSLALRADGSLLDRKMGKLSPQDLQDWNARA